MTSPIQQLLQPTCPRGSIGTTLPQSVSELSLPPSRSELSLASCFFIPTLETAWSIDFRGPLLRVSIRLIRRMNPQRSLSMQAHERQPIKVARIRPSEPAASSLAISLLAAACPDDRKPTPPAVHTQTPSPDSHTRRSPSAAPSRP